MCFLKKALSKNRAPNTPRSLNSLYFGLISALDFFVSDLHRMEEDCSCLIYLQTDKSLYCLEALDVLKKGSSGLSRLDNYDYPEGLPNGLGFMTCDNKLYMLGGAANLKMYSCDHPDEHGQSIIISPTQFPSMYGPKTDPIVVTLEDKVYVLSTSLYGYVEEHRPALFEVYNSVTKVWKVLPNPPSPYGFRDYRNYDVYHYSWGNKIVFFIYPGRNTYMFDTTEETWEAASNILGLAGCGFVPFEEHLIGISLDDSLALVACKVDENGIPKHKQMLLDLDNMGDRFWEPILITPIDDKGHICILLGGSSERRKQHVEVCMGIFKLSTPREGIPELSANLLFTKSYTLEFARSPKISSAIVMGRRGSTQPAGKDNSDGEL